MENEGYTYNVELDPEPFHPFEDDDGKLSTFVFEHRRYNLGDMGPEEFAAKHNLDPEELITRAGSINRHHPEVLACEYVEMLDHSGLRFYLQRDRLTGKVFIPYGGWDSGVIGVAVVTREDFARVGLDPDAPDARDKALDNIRSEVSVLDDYHSGQVYGYEVYDPDGDVIDSCYGFYGSAGEDEAEKEAQASVENFALLARQAREAKVQAYKQEAFLFGA